MSVFKILEGLQAELKAAAEYEEFIIREVQMDGAAYRLLLNIEEGDGRLDESLEGAAAWWPGPPKGTADVLSVIPEDEQMNLRFASTVPPGKGQKIRVYPPRYLERLLELWDAPGKGDQYLNWWERHRTQNELEVDLELKPDGFPWLRSAQREAFNLTRWRTGYLWGPPGTGKTTTLGSILAAYLVKFPMRRVLLLSTTNTAVDQALIAVDSSLESLTRGQPQPSILRKSCARIGNHFQAGEYKGREHLIPVRNEGLVTELAEVEAAVPEKSQIRAYQSWKEKVEALRQKIRNQALDALRQCRLAAMTTTRAVFTYEQLVQSGSFDLVVF